MSLDSDEHRTCGRGWPALGGNQQFTTRNLVFSGCRTAIDMLWDWGWTWKSLIISTTEYGIKMTIAGKLANVDVIVYKVVGDPHSALMTVFGFVMGVGVSRQPFREAAAARRGIGSGPARHRQRPGAASAAARRGIGSAEANKLAPRIKNDIDTMTNGQLTPHGKENKDAVVENLPRRYRNSHGPSLPESITESAPTHFDVIKSSLHAANGNYIVREQSRNSPAANAGY
ncbi:hypothetical protein LZ31DRAFT_543871 [Colletotrichum somersetense]|nr:hypothetical protein LZ31DRAFT_543871 [Colletotrichum somersetense]